MTTEEADEYATWWRRQYPLGRRDAPDPLLKELFDSLGLAGRVDWDPAMWGWRITAWQKPVRQAVTIDEEIFVHGGAYRDQAIRMINREIENLQLRVHDETRKAMAAKDVWGRHQMLTREEKDTLHEMWRIAVDRLYAHFVYTEGDGDGLRQAKERAYNEVFAKVMK